MCVDNVDLIFNLQRRSESVVPSVSGQPTLLPRVDAINSFELKSFMDECFKVTTDPKLLPAYRRILDRICHDISDAGIEMSKAPLVQLVTTAIASVDQVMKPEWHFLLANYLDIHSKHKEGCDDPWWTDDEDKTAFQLLLLVFPAKDALGSGMAARPKYLMLIRTIVRLPKSNVDSKAVVVYDSK